MNVQLCMSNPILDRCSNSFGIFCTLRAVYSLGTPEEGEGLIKQAMQKSLVMIH